MRIEIDNQHDVYWELRGEQELTGVPMSSECCTQDLAHLVDEALTCAVINDHLPADAEDVRAIIRPLWKQEPIIDGVQITLAVEGNGRDGEFVYQCRSGPWVRAAQRRLAQLRNDQSLAETAAAYRVTIALPNSNAVVPADRIQPPVVIDGSLADCGIRRLGEEALTPHRPVLLNSRFAEEAVQYCVDADVLEAGGAVLGRIVRLNERLPGATSHVITILSSIVPDSRHVGTESQFQLSPEALAEAQLMADMRGLGEQILTVFHTHGWSNKCGNCNSNASCPLFECTPSLHDYAELLDQLFTSKTTVLPIAGRKFGAEGRRPVLQVFAWHEGEMQPVRWQTYRD